MEHKCKKTYLKTVEKCELNAENIKNEIQSLIKALKDCGGWVKRGNGEGWFNHEILADTLAIITSQEQRIGELTDKNEGLKAENALLLNMHVADDYSGESLRIKINLPDPLKSSGEEYVVNRQETIKLLIQKNKELTEENERLNGKVAEYEEERKYHFEMSKKRIAEAVRKMQEEVSAIVGDLVEMIFDDNESNCLVPNCNKPDSIGCGNRICIDENKAIWFDMIDQIAKETLEDKNVTKNN